MRLPPCPSLLVLLLSAVALFLILLYRSVHWIMIPRTAQLDLVVYTRHARIHLGLQDVVQL